MSRLDHHVRAVQRKLTLAGLLDSAAWAAAGVAAAALIAILVDRLVHFALPTQALWYAIGAGAVFAIIWSLIRAPGRQQAAVAIDQTLSLKEKFSTALYIRTSGDEFAQAAVRDAESTAQNVNISGRFPLRFPRQTWYAVGLALLALLSTRLGYADLFGREEAQKKQQQKLAAVESARQVVKDAIVRVDSIADKVGANEAVAEAKRALEQLEREPIKEPSRTKMTAAQVLQDLKDALKAEKEKVKQQAAEAQKLANRMFEVTQPHPDEKGPVADARRDLAKGDFAKALAEVEKVVENFDKMDKKDQEQAAQQMQKLAEQLQQMANDPKVQQQVQQQLQKQLQQAGMNQQQAGQQAQQMQKLMQQAAAGNQQAAQQLQQMANQAMQQMQGDPQKKQAMQQAMQQAMNQCQAQANAQCQAGQMSQAAGQMAQAMRQGPQGAQGQNQQGMNQAQQQMKQAMQDAMAQMQGVQQAANADAAQREAAQAARQAAGQCDGKGGNDPGQAQAGRNQGQGQWDQGDPQNQGQGQGGPGIGAGGNMPREAAPFQSVKAHSPTEHDAKGKLLSSSLVRDGVVVKGENAATLREVAQAGQKEQTDDVDDARADRRSAEMMKRYFRTMEKDAGQK